jgi:hypothetical protein
VTHALSPVAAAAERLNTALRMIPELRVPNISESISPPAAVVGPPQLTWRGYGSVGVGPITAQWNIYLVVSVSQFAIDQLLALVAQVTDVIENFTPGVVLSSGPGSYTSTGGALPAYVITCQMEV